MTDYITPDLRFLADIRDLLTDIKSLLEAQETREMAWVAEVRKRDEEIIQANQVRDDKYDRWRKEDLARLKRDQRTARQNYELAAQVYISQLKDMFAEGRAAQRLEEMSLEKAAREE